MLDTGYWILDTRFWIPVFTGMTEEETGTGVPAYSFRVYSWLQLIPVSDFCVNLWFHFRIPHSAFCIKDKHTPVPSGHPLLIEGTKRCRVLPFAFIRVIRG